MTYILLLRINNAIEDNHNYYAYSELVKVVLMPTLSQSLLQGSMLYMCEIEEIAFCLNIDTFAI